MSINKQIFLSIITILFLANHALSQDTINKKPSLKGLPAAFYLPETRVGIGCIGILTFYMKKDISNQFPSSLTFGAAYTQNKQILLFLPYNLYLKNRKHWLYGEVGYYKYIYNFYGIGNFIPNDYSESYTANFSRLRLTALTKISKSKFIYTGIKYAYDAININQLDSTGLLHNTAIPGNRGGTISGIGWVTSYDTRNHAFYPNKGELIEFFIYNEDSYTGSTFKYWRTTLDASSFHTFAPKHILALNFYGAYIQGDVAFTHLPMLGGDSKMRGYYEGRYRDKVALTWQAEWRYKFHKRLGLNVFASTGVIAPELNAIALREFKYSAGGGLRFVLDKKQGVNLRADFAVGHGSTGLYLTIGEAF
jgi:outer membrane protein assembly factor BamA